MINFITLSSDPTRAQGLIDSIEACAHGCGHPWAMQVADGNKFDLFTGYNRAARQTSGDYLVFVHDDVRILANREALRLPLELLEQSATGFLGVAGCRTVLADAGGWWRRETLADTRGMAAHPSAENEFGLHWNVWPYNFCAVFGRVAVLDGALLMCHRRTFDRLEGFSESCYQGFHFYDIDISFRAALLQLANYAIPFPIFHESVGFPDAGWEANRQVFLNRFGSLLPFSI
jgi:hypothetical protein